MTANSVVLYLLKNAICKCSLNKIQGAIRPVANYGDGSIATCDNQALTSGLSKCFDHLTNGTPTFFF
jgi:hypothetical protein